MGRSLWDASAVVAATLVSCLASCWAAPGILEEGLKENVSRIPVALVAAAAVAVLLAALAWRPTSKKASDGKPRPATAVAVKKGAHPSGDPVIEPIRWSFVPSTGVMRANAEHPVSFENDLASIKGIAMHRPTHEPWREATGDYPYSWHFSGRKRLWEVRIQVRFKQLPKGPLYFGLEMRYVPFSMSFAAKQAQNLVLRAFQAIGGEFHQSPGDDPAATDGEAEPPTFAMPMWAIDQFHESLPGEEPDLTGDLEGVGHRRSDGMKAYVDALRQSLETLSTDRVYTFCLWGVSQFADAIHWEVRGLWRGFKLDANKLAGAPPTYIVLYDMPGHDASRDRRHLVSKKRYYFKVAMWSTLRPADEATLRSFGVGAVERPGESSRQAHERQRGGPFARWLGSTMDAFSCCSASSRFSRSASPGADGCPEDQPEPVAAR